MAVVSSCREMVGYAPQRAQPPSHVASIKLGTHARLPVTNRRKVGMTSSHHAPYVQGYTRATLAGTKGCDAARWSESQKAGLGSDWRLKLASMKAELLVIPDQQRRGEYVPGPCTHRPSHHESGQHPKPVIQPSGRKPSKVELMIGVKS